MSGSNPILVHILCTLLAAVVSPSRSAYEGMADQPIHLSFNVLNYFTTLGSRGAQTEDQRADQLAKITAGALALNVDAIAIIEVSSMNREIPTKWFCSAAMPCAMCPACTIAFSTTSRHTMECHGGLSLGKDLISAGPEPWHADVHELTDDGHRDVALGPPSERVVL